MIGCKTVAHRVALVICGVWLLLGCHANAMAQANPPAAGSATAPSDLRRLQQQAAGHLATVSTCVARFHRRELTDGKGVTDEWQLFKWRKQPWSVYFKWIGNEHQGREVIYVRGGQLHTLLAAGDMPLTPAGKHIALPIDSIFVRNASRHSITEAGIDNVVAKYTFLVNAYERGDTRHGTLRYLGQVRRPECANPMEAVEQTIPTRVDNDIPRGGKRWWLFEASTHLPVLVITADAQGHEVEYYCYDQIQENASLTAEDFNPARWDRPTR